MGFGGAVFSEGEGSLYAIGMSTGLAGALYFKIKENEEKQMLETFRKKFNLDYQEGWGSKIEIKESYH